MLISSIDLMNGKAVQLKQGRELVLEFENPVEIGNEFGKFGKIAVIDLDAAFEKGSNTEIIREICKTNECSVGGGIRTV
jgi:phosphoribosyl-AMP cyclohydrolase / phosphoribosyl-ATP pyrophosphohydrolase